MNKIDMGRFLQYYDCPSGKDEYLLGVGYVLRKVNIKIREQQPEVPIDGGKPKT